jgi:hypothetical protein
MAQRPAAVALWIDVSSELDAEEVSWFAIRQPAVIKLLERELWDGDGDAFAVALDAVCRVAMRVAALDGLPPPRLTHKHLDHGLMLARAGEVDRALARWVRWCIDAAPVVLSAEQEQVVLDVVAAMLWAIAAADLQGVEPTMADAVIA